MKRWICMLLALLMTAGCAWAEEASMWENEAGWTAFSLALSQEGLEAVWDESALIFAENMGLPGLSGAQLRTMLLQGYSLEHGVDELKAEGNRFTGLTREGKEVFSHEYTPVETLEEADIMGGAKVHVLQTEDRDAGGYTSLLMTEPLTTGDGESSYVTFNLFVAGKDYRKVFADAKKGSALIPCAMIRTDTAQAGLAYAIEKIFSSPVKNSK